MENIELNEFQTPLSQLNLDKQPDEVKEQFLDFFYNVPFIQNLTSKDRKRAKDLPRDDKGRIIIDITHPHILEDMDYFRPAAIYYQQHGCYTKLRPNDNPNSEFGKWITEEVRRCREGYVRESDGEWITGDYYYFLNYAPMQLVKKEDKNSKKGRRVFDFPNVWEGHYLKSHALNQAREQGHHYAELSSRGRGKAHPYDEFVYTTTGIKKWGDIQIGDYVYGDDGKPTKVINIPFDDICPIYEITLANGRKVKCSEGHLWKVKSHCRNSKEFIIISTKELLQLYKRPRNNKAGYELDCTIPIHSAVEFEHKDTKVDPYVFGLLLGNGCFRVPNCNSKTYFTSSDEDFETYKKYIPYNWIKYNNTKCGYNLNIPHFKDILETYGLYFKKSEEKFIPEEYKINSIDVRINLLKGILDSDGTVTPEGKIEIVITSKKLIEDIKWICDSLGINYTKERIKHTFYYDKNHNRKKCLDAYRLSIFSNIPLFNLPRKLEIWNNKSKTNYALSKYKGSKITNIEYIGEQKAKCITVDNESHCYLINNFITTHNSFYAAAMLAKRFILGESKEVNKKVVSYITADDKKYLVGGDQTLDKFQFDIDWASNNMEWPSKRLINSLSNMQWIMGYKDMDSGTNKGTLNSVIGVTSKDDPQKLRGTRGVLYVIEEFGTFGALLDLISNLRPSVEDGEDVFGTIVAYGTAGDKESDFSSAQEIVYNPEGYNFIAFDNVYDKVGQGKRKFAFFFPGYLNMANCYDSNGNSDVTKALLSILKDRYFVKYHSTNINAISKRIAEIPITPQEAMLKSRGNIFPVTQLTQRLNEMDNNPTFHDSTYVGELVQNSKGEIIFQPTKDEPIREYPIKNNKEAGAIEIWKMPEKDSYGKVMQNRYIIGHDPVDQDAADTASLTSTFVLDTFTDQIVAEYTGRQQFADDNFEIVRKLCLFYNAKCLYEAHPYSQIVYTPDGKKLWKDIKIGDKLFSPTKGIVTVTDIPIDEKIPIYNITLSDGRTVQASDNHIWLVYKGTSKTPIELTTKQMLDIGIKNKHNQHVFFIPQNNGVEYNTKQLPIDPYTMGLVLAEGSIIGDHCFKNGLQISSSFEDMEFYKQNIPYEIKHIGTKGFSWHLYINNCKDILIKYNLYGTNSHTKFIPEDYLFSDRIQRMELLKGLMDGDGCASTDGAAIFTTCSNKLAQGIMLLVRSLGIKCWLQIPRPNVYRVAIASVDKVFKLPRKVNRQHIYQPYKKGSKASAILNKTAIVNIEYSHDEMGKCVTVDSEDGLYLIGDYITTHNCNKKGMFAYFQKFNCLWLLKDTPQYLKDVDVVKAIGYGNNAKGVNATLPVNNYANEKIRDWLLKPVTSINPDTGEETTVPNLAFIRSRALLKELIAFNPDINVDRVRALGMVMLYREEMLINGRGTIDKKERKPKIEDEYFSKNYDLKFGISH